jgi:hypothetical protein
MAATGNNNYREGVRQPATAAPNRKNKRNIRGSESADKELVLLEIYSLRPRPSQRLCGELFDFCAFCNSFGTGEALPDFIEIGFAAMTIGKMTKQIGKVEYPLIFG